ncbi:cell division-specific peptidoglycan biosynthesis regulator FtsW [Syntrophus gentianae]|uniref:Probable peptidoglycan glycosyltransferase FtsW n=1 Tax=Syntrophus gentianae TaxID=43775 RepID=A0A1H7X6Z5_9BACT|nr:putative lipid II flippase FtsW [Syntrophus gentianae]SEM28967.1 cell division-specific peptidoglycan biosynthesis regulator FtsW [Syntrophus gentianae]
MIGFLKRFSLPQLPIPNLAEGDKRPDIVLLLTVLVLVSIGTVMIYSSSSIMAAASHQDGGYFLKKQVVFVLLGFGIMILMAKIPYYYLKQAAYPGILVCIVLLSLVLIPHVGVRAGGATRWLRMGFFSFQVSELAKVCMILFLAHFLNRKIDYRKNFRRGVVVPLAVTAVIMLLIILEPDFGTCAIMSVILMLMFYMAGARLVHLGALVAAIIPVGIWFVFHEPYRVSRLTAFLDPWQDPQRSGFQIIQSLISFGSGGAFGVGVGDSMQKLFYLPEPHTDFILSIIAEEAGFVGVFVVIALFVVLIFRGFFIAFKAPDLFGTLVAAGLSMLLALEAVINIAGVMGLIPLKGLALPFLSYGGTSLVVSLAAIGILLNISTFTETKGESQ